MRWLFLFVGLTLSLAAVEGCKQPCYLAESDYDHYIKDLHLPTDTACKTQGINGAATDVFTPAPPTVDDPDREVRYLSLAETVAMALEHGTIGNPDLYGLPTNNSLNAAQRTNFNLVSFSGNAVFGDDAIRVLALDPAIIGANIEASLAKFDAQLVSSVTWNTTDQPISSAIQQFQAGNTGLNSIRTSDANVSTSVLKPLPTGGVAGITFSTAYEFTNLPARVNPSYRPTLQFQFEQPLLQGFGVEINQLRSSHPGSVLTPFNTGGRVEGILITRLRFDQQRAEFQRNVNLLLLNAEEAYWQLYAAYWQLYSREAELRQAFEAWKITKAKFEAGQTAAPLAVLAQSRGQYELVRGQRLTALETVLESEQGLRNILGLPATDGKRLVPIDTPTLAPFQPDWETAMQEALTLRPELILAREDLKFRQLDLINQRNLLLPDLRFTSTYDINGLGSRLDGPMGDNALRSLAGDHFNNWTVGLRFQMPLGRRDAYSAVRIARLNLARSYYVLQDQERKAIHYLTIQYRHVIDYYQAIAIQRSQREAYGEQVKARFAGYQAGLQGYTLDILLEAQRFWADALFNEYSAIADYNIALALFEYSKGTLLQHDNVLISEGELPQCAQVRAVDHERERAIGLIARERDNPIAHVPCCKDGGPCMPDLPKDGGVALPSLFTGASKAGDVLPNLPTTPDLMPGVKPELPEVIPAPKIDTGAGVGNRTISTFPSAALPSTDRMPLPLPLPPDTGKNVNPPPLTLPPIPAGPGGR